MKPFLQRTQKSTDSASKWNDSKSSSVNARLICTNFGTVLFGSSVNRVLKYMVKKINYVMQSDVIT